MKWKLSIIMLFVTLCINAQSKDSTVTLNVETARFYRNERARAVHLEGALSRCKEREVELEGVIAEKNKQQQTYESDALSFAAEIKNLETSNQVSRDSADAIVNTQSSTIKKLKGVTIISIVVATLSLLGAIF